MPRENPRHPNYPIPSGPTLRAKGWRQEGLLRLLENVLAVGENPDELIVYAALGKAARNWAAHEAIVEALTTMDEDQTLIIQSGKPIGLLKTHAKAPLVIMANCNIVGQWAKAEVFYELQKKGLIVWGGLTAGAWQYIGSQGVIQGTYEIFMRIAEKRFGGELAGRFILTAGLGGMGGAQPLAGRMAGAAILCIDVDAERARKRQEIGYLEADRARPRHRAGDDRRRGAREARDLDRPRRQCRRRSIPRSSRAASSPTSSPTRPRAHDLVYGYVPKGMSLDEVKRLREDGPAQLMAREPRLDRRPRPRHARFQRAGRRGVRQRQPHPHAGEAGRRRRTPSTSRSSPRPICARCSPAPSARSAGWRCRAIPRTSRKIDDRLLADVPRQPASSPTGSRLARKHVPFEGLPARIAWLGHGERTAAGARGQRDGARRASSRARSRSAATISMPAPWRIPTS